MSNYTNFLGIEIPYLPHTYCSRSDIKCFPNPRSRISQLLKLLKSNGIISCDNQAIRSLFDNTNRFWITAMMLKYESLICIDSNELHLSTHGQHMVEIIDWFEPVYDIVEFISASGVEDADELDVQLALAGKHYLMSEDVISRVRMVFLYEKRTLGTDVHMWVETFLDALAYRINVSFVRIFKKLFDRLDAHDLTT